MDNHLSIVSFYSPTMSSHLAVLGLLVGIISGASIVYSGDGGGDATGKKLS